MRYRVRWVCIVMMAALTGAADAAAKSIFDDDGWVPPARTPAPADPPPVKPSDPPPPVKPADPSVFNPAPRPAPPVPKRAPIPAKAALDASRQQFRTLFAADLADKTAKARQALAAKLIDGGHRCADKPADQYALYAGARQAALEAKDLHLCYAAADALAATFDVDALAVKGEAATTLGVRGETPAATSANLEGTMPILETLIASEDYAAASKLAVAMQKAATDDPFFRHVLPRRAKEVEGMRVAFDRVKRDRDKLKATPDDPAACGSVGAYLCFLRGDWKQGLPLLAKGTLPELKKLAATEAGGVGDPEALRKLADGWAAAAARQPEPSRGSIVEHALDLYRHALAGTTGMQKLPIEAAIQKAAKSLGPRRIDLLPMVDPAQDAIGGPWSVEDGTLKTGGEPTRLELPYAPGEEYVFKVEFIATGDLSVRPSLAKAGKSFLYVLGNLANTYAGFDTFAGAEVGNNKTRVELKLDPAQRHVLVIEVYNNRVRATVDGKVVHDLPTPYAELGAPRTPQFAPKDPARLGLCLWHTPATFYQVQVAEVTGAGRVLR